MQGPCAGPMCEIGISCVRYGGPHLPCRASACCCWLPTTHPQARPSASPVRAERGCEYELTVAVCRCRAAWGVDTTCASPALACRQLSAPALHISNQGGRGELGERAPHLRCLAHVLGQHSAPAMERAEGVGSAGASPALARRSFRQRTGEAVGVDVSLTCAGSQSRHCGGQGGLGRDAQEGHQHPRGRCPRDDSLQGLQRV